MADHLFSSVRNRLSRGRLHLLEKVENAWIGASRLLNLPVERRMARITPQKGRAVVRVPLAAIGRFLPNSELSGQFAPDPVSKTYIREFFWKGDWDRRARSIDFYAEVNPHFRSMIQILQEGVHYRECDEYKSKKKALEQGEPSVRGRTVEELDRYFKGLLRLAERIRENGYKSQEELEGDYFDEIGVFVDREGNLIKAEEKFSGTHRFAIARHLDIPEVPVAILAVHYEWGRNNEHLLVNNEKKLENYFW